MSDRLSSADAKKLPAISAIRDPAEQIRVQKLVDGARLEGALSWIGVQFEKDRAEIIFAEFKRYYGLDELVLDYSYTPTGQIIFQVDRLLAEGRNTIDIVWSSSWGWYKDLLRRGEIMEYHSPHYSDYTLSDKYGMSVAGYWVSDAYTFSPLYNFAALEKLGIRDFNPTSWDDLTDPRLADAICMIDVHVSTTAAPVLAGIAKKMGNDWLNALGANRPTLFTRGADSRENVEAGNFAITLFATPADRLMLMERNVPVGQAFPKEGVVLVPFAPIILQSAPHPNAARLFIDFVRSGYGTQAVMADKAGALIVSGRPGIKPKYPDIIPAAESLMVIPFDWDREDTVDAIATFRAKAYSAGIKQR